MLHCLTVQHDAWLLQRLVKLRGEKSVLRCKVDAMSAPTFNASGRNMYWAAKIHIWSDANKTGVLLTHQKNKYRNNFLKFYRCKW